MNVEAAALRYRPLGRFAEGFARGKMGGDPAYATVLAQLPARGTLLDVGCGEGYLLALAAEESPALELVGLDHDPRRLEQARVALADRTTTLSAEDARVAVLPAADVVTCLDVLHYQPVPEQDALIARLAAALRPGGKLLVRDGASDGGWRSAITALSERMMVALGRHRGDGVYFRPRAATQAAMERCGLVVDAVDCAAGTPFANVLFVGTRPG